MNEITIPAIIPAAVAGNLTNLISERAHFEPERVLVSRPMGDRWQAVTAKEYEEEIKAVAKGFIAAGIGFGDRVAIMAKTRYEWTVLDFAIWYAGAVPVPIYETSSAEQVDWILTDSGAVAIVVETPALAELVQPVMPATCKKIWNITYNALATLSHEGKDVSEEEITKRRAGLKPETLATLIYTSGTTGKPKGVQHSTGGYILWAILTMKWTFDIKPSDVFWCTADIGWVTGHSYIAYGPLAVGGTQIVFEGVPTFPNAGRFWEMIQKHKATIFYTAPTAIRSLIKASNTDPNVHPKNYDLSSLRLLGSVGEPINPEAWMWYYENIGGSRCPIADTFWQTETGGHMISPLPGATPMVPGSCTLPLPGIMTAIVDETGNDMPNGQGGILVVKRPWPSMIRTIWGDPDRFVKAYFPDEFGRKLYLAGDGAIRNKDTGYFTITGRIDDVLNVSGHRMGTMEIESTLVANPLVAEAAVVGRPDEMTGEAICAFVVLKGKRPEGEEAKKIATELRNWVAKEIGPIAKPKDIRFGDNLPKTRSGKIMRRLLRVIAKGEEITQDTSTLENPAILDQLKQPL